MSKYSRRVKIIKKINKAPIGSLVIIPTDQHGTPYDPFWRKIFKDSKIDQCVEILDEKNTINTTQDKAERDRAKIQRVGIPKEGKAT